MKADFSNEVIGSQSTSDDADLLSPQRWIWAASHVQKLSGGLQKAITSVTVGATWNERLLVLPAHTGCLHWLRDDGGTNITTLGIERGSIRLTDVESLSILPDSDDDGRQILQLVISGLHSVQDVAQHLVAQRARFGMDSGRQHHLAFRAATEIVHAWEKTITAAMAIARKRNQPTGLWLDGVTDGITVDTPPAPLPVQECLVFRDPRIQFMGFALQQRPQSCHAGECLAFAGQGEKFMLLVVSGSQFRWFEPKDRLLLGVRKGSLDLKSLKSASMMRDRAMFTFERHAVIFKSPHCKEWVARIRDASTASQSPRANSTPSSTFASLVRTSSKVLQRSTNARTQAALDSVADKLIDLTGLDSGEVQNLANADIHPFRKIVCVILLWNGTLALALQIQGTRAFWMLLVCANIFTVLLLTWESRVPTEAAARDRKASIVVDDHVVPSRFLKNGSGPGCVKDGDATTILVRAPGYASTKRKQPSLSAFYELVRVQVMAPPTDDCKHSHICVHSTVLEDECLSMPGPLPQFFVLNMQLPEGPPSMFQKAGIVCSSLVFYFRVRQDTQTAAADLSQVDPALQLLLACCRQAPSKRDLQEKMKVICRIKNPSESGLPSIVRKYDGKPAMITKAGTLFEGSGYLEMDVDVSGCPYLFRSTLHEMRNCVEAMELSIAVVIQADREEHLPERVLACADLHKVPLNSDASAAASAATELSPTASAPEQLHRRNAAQRSADSS